MISQTVEYALRAMSFLASRAGTPASCDAIAQVTLVPRQYLSKVMRDLVRADLVRSRRGPRGGFALSRPARDVRVLDVVNAVEPIRRIERCPLGNPLHVALCPLHRCLDDALALIEGTLAGTTLDQMTERGADPRCCRTLGRTDAPCAHAALHTHQEHP